MVSSVDNTNGYTCLYLDVSLGEEPWLVSKQFVDSTEIAQLEGRILKSFQPFWITTIEEVFLLAEIDQISTPVPCGRLQKEKMNTLSKREKLCAVSGELTSMPM